MNRYIDAKKCKLAMSYYGFRAPDMTITEFIEDECPAADVEEVKHGHWIKYAKYSFGTMYDCSICSTRIIDDGHSWHYCPNCGAKMDGEREDKE